MHAFIGLNILCKHLHLYCIKRNHANVIKIEEDYNVRKTHILQHHGLVRQNPEHVPVFHLLICKQNPVFGIVVPYRGSGAHNVVCRIKLWVWLARQKGVSPSLAAGGMGRTEDAAHRDGWIPTRYRLPLRVYGGNSYVRELDHRRCPVRFVPLHRSSCH